MTIIASNVRQSDSAERIEEHYRQYVAAVRQQGGVTGVGTVGSPPVVATSPPVVIGPRDGIDPLDLDHVRPGDLITADFVNGLIDVVTDIDARLQRIENLLARLLDRDKATASPPEVIGKP